MFIPEWRTGVAMLCNMCTEYPLAVNHHSGRIVVELEPELKLALHAALAAEGLSLKEWLDKNAREFVAGHRQPSLAFDRQATGRREA